MTLSFSTHWADGSPNYFVRKIWEGICQIDNWFFYQTHNITANYIKEVEQTQPFPNVRTKDIFGDFSDKPLHPKLHTLREDKKDRWKAGNKIHPVIHNRTPNRFQFAPTMECKSVQNVFISQIHQNGHLTRTVIIDRELFWHELSHDKHFENMNQFVKNDGFEDIDSFFEFFFPNGEEGEKQLKLIHWTNLQY